MVETSREGPLPVAGASVKSSWERNETPRRMQARTFRMTPWDQLIFESCHSTWLFDTKHLRFRRILKGFPAGDHQVVTEWRDYFGLEFEPGSEAFTVKLNPQGTRLLRSWRHTHDCADCGGHETIELSLNELGSVLA